jgi:hypothetical protein
VRAALGGVSFADMDLFGGWYATSNDVREQVLEEKR